MQETNRQAWLLDFGLGHPSSAATACADKMRICCFYDGLCQSSVRKLWLFLKACEKFLITRVAGLDLEEVRKKAWISCLLLALFCWGLQPLLFPPYSCFGAPGPWTDESGSLQKICRKNGILNFQAFLLISQSNFLYKYNPP